MKRRLLSLALALTLYLGLLPTALAAGELPFTDVAENTWYYSDVAAAYGTGLFTGTSDTTFEPNGTLTLAQAVVLAVRVHQYVRTGRVEPLTGAGAWYDPYVDYAKANGIISNAYDGRWGENVTRADMVQIFYNALPADHRKEINDVEDNAIPDVKLTYPCGEAVYAFYRAGILTGSDSTYKNVRNGSNYFKPKDTIRRCEVAATLNRMLNPEQRLTLALRLPEIPAYGDEITEENVLALLDNFDPDGAAIIRKADSWYAGDKLNFMSYFQGRIISLGNSKDRLVSAMASNLSTAVHEECHLVWSHSGSQSQKICYIGDGETIAVDITETFKTEEMSRLLPEDLQTFRYKTYVAPGSSTSANKSGIYGLLDEFTAYYWGNHNCMSMMAGWYDRRPTTEASAYAEFRFWSLSYMLYAKEYHPDVYQGVLENDSYRLAFSTIDRKFRAEAEEVMSRPFEVTYDEYNKLMSIMERPEYVEMAALLQP